MQKLLAARRAAKVSHFVAFSLTSGCSKMPEASLNSIIVTFFRESRSRH
jgi:hypothetical protein